MSRICIITHSGYPVEPRARRMAETLAAHAHAVDVLCLQLPGQAADEWLNGVHVIRLPETRHQGAGALAYFKEYARFFFLAGRELRRHHRRAPYTLVQVHNPPDALVFTTLPLKLTGVPIILDLRELMPELFMSRFRLARNSAIVRLLAWLERLACRYAAAVLVLHDRHRRIMQGRGIPAAKLTQVMNCPDDRIFDPAAVTRGRPPDEHFVVINHGGILQRYGVDLLVQAVALARNEMPGLRLELYGTGDYQPTVERLVAELGLADIVHFHGQRPLEEMPAAIVQADVGVAPMRQDIFTDCGLPTKLLEYVALGVPGIASRTATTADYFDDSMVLLFEPGNAADLAAKLLVTYRDRPAAEVRAARARRFTETYNWRAESATYLALVARLTQPARRTSA